MIAAPYITCMLHTSWNLLKIIHEVLSVLLDVTVSVSLWPCGICGTGGMIRFETCPKNFTTFRRWALIRGLFSKAEKNCHVMEGKKVRLAFFKHFGIENSQLWQVVTSCIIIVCCPCDCRWWMWIIRGSRARYGMFRRGPGGRSVRWLGFVSLLDVQRMLQQIHLNFCHDRSWREGKMGQVGFWAFLEPLTPPMFLPRKNDR